MLLITNGDSVVDTIRESGWDGDILPWRDILHEGPVTAEPLSALSAVRAAFLASGGYAPLATLQAEFRARDQQFLRWREHAEVVLLFEHDLYDQLQLIQILHELHHLDRGQTQITLSNPARYLGHLNAQEMAQVIADRLPVTDAQCETADYAWRMFTSDDPLLLAGLLQESLNPLPFLRPALTRLLEEYPGVDDGLSRTQRSIVGMLSHTEATDKDLFRACQAGEEAAFLGDTTFFQVLACLATSPRPAVELVNGRYRTTDFGRDLNEGRADWLAHNPLDRWIGGVHLQSPDRIWRWNGATLLA